jgi:hypothetical protein
VDLQRIVGFSRRQGELRGQQMLGLSEVGRVILHYKISPMMPHLQDSIVGGGGSL